MDSATMFAVWSHFIPLSLESSTSTVFVRHLRKSDSNCLIFINNMPIICYRLIIILTILLIK